MNINSYGAKTYYGSAVYQDQTARCNEAENAAGERSSQKILNSKDEYIPEDAVIRPVKTVMKEKSDGSFWEALKKQSDFFMSVQRADFEFTKYGRPEDVFTSSGDARNDASIRAGLIYQRSCIDFTHADELSIMSRSEDLRGMSPEEIYLAIYRKYQHCYGEHFMDMKAVDFIMPPDRDDDAYMGILKKFNKEVKEACGLSDYRERFELRRNALYPGMSDYEVEQAIIDEYAERLGYNMTNADICKMCQEMQDCGVGHGVRNFFNTQENFNIYGYGTSITDVGAQSAWLNRKASAQTFDQVYTAFKTRPAGAFPVDPEVGGMILRIKEAVCPEIKFYR